MATGQSDGGDSTTEVPSSKQVCQVDNKISHQAAPDLPSIPLATSVAKPKGQLLPPAAHPGYEL